MFNDISGSNCKEFACDAEDLGQEDPMERKWQPTPIFLPGKPHGQGSQTGYSPWGRKELHKTE